MKTRNGKIARLPKSIREELNRRMEDGWQNVKLVAWLNELPEVRQVLREQFHDEPITEPNLSRWKEGGYEDWLRHRESHEQLRWMIERGEDINTQEGDSAEWIAQVATAELSTQLQQLSEVNDPKERWKLFRELLQELSRLRTATSYRQSVELGWKRWERTAQREDQAWEQERWQKERERMQSWDQHLDWLMDLMHQPGVRQWANTQWANRDEEWRALRRIYHLDPDSNNTIIHPVQVDRQTLKRHAIYNYPAGSNEKPTANSASELR
jgi:hypothetical protein